MVAASRNRFNRFLLPAILLGTAALFIWFLGPDSAEKVQINNTMYLDRIARVIFAYEKRHGHVASDPDEALADGAETLPNRGDFYGGPLSYARACDSAFFMQASTLKLYYAQGKRVSRQDFVTWVHSHPDGTNDRQPDLWLQTYGF